MQMIIDNIRQSEKIICVWGYNKALLKQLTDSGVCVSHIFSGNTKLVKDISNRVESFKNIPHYLKDTSPKEYIVCFLGHEEELLNQTKYLLENGFSRDSILYRYPCEERIPLYVSNSQTDEKMNYKDYSSFIKELSSIKSIDNYLKALGLVDNKDIIMVLEQARIKKNEEQKMLKRLVSITAIDDYLTILNLIKRQCLIIITVKDTPGFCVRERTDYLLSSLGVKTTLRNQHGHSFVAIIDEGNVICEHISKYDESTVFENISLHRDTVSVTALSSVYQKENLSVMMVNGVDYSLNRRGLNFLVYNLEKQEMIDRISFDTHMEKNPGYRSAVVNSKYIAGLSNSISHKLLVDILEKQNQRINKLENEINVNNEKNQLLLWQIYRKDEESDKQTKIRFFRALPSATGTLRKVQLVFNAILKNFDRICRDNEIQYWLGFGTLLGAVRHGGYIPWDDDADVCMVREEYLKFREAIKQEADFDATSFFDVNGPNWKHYGRGYKVRVKNIGIPYSLDIFIFDYADSQALTKEKELNDLKIRMSEDAWIEGNLPDIPKTKVQHQRGIFEGSSIYVQHEKFFHHYLEKYKKLLGDVGEKEVLVWGIDNPNFNWGPIRFHKMNHIFPLKEIEFEGHMYLCPNKPEGFLEVFYGDIYSVPDDMFTHKHFDMSKANVSKLDEVIKKFV